RIRGVYFSIITQALALSAWLVFNRNEMRLGGTNGLADFKTIFGFPLNQPSTQRGLYAVTAATLVVAYLVCRRIAGSRAGKVLIAIRDSETRVLFSGYSPARYKLFDFVVSAVLAGVAGALYPPPVGRARLVAHGTCAVDGHADRERPQPGMTSAGSIIYLEDVTVSYDGFKALSRLNFYMDRRELRVVIGPNGAGKTTLLDVISGR